MRVPTLLLAALVTGQGSPGTSADLPDALDTPAILAERAASAALLDLTLGPDGPVAVGERGVIIGLQGEVWRQQEAPVSATLTAVAFGADGTALAVGHDGVILRQPPKGAWEKVTDGRALFESVIETAQARHDAAASALAGATDETRSDLEFELDDQLFRLETAQQSLAYGPSWPLLDVVFSDDTTAWAVGAYGILFRSDDAGRTWSLASDRLDNFEDLHLNAILQTRAGSLLIAGEGGMIFRSNDRGTSFERWDTDQGLSLFGLAETEAMIVAYGFGNSVQISTDDGATWRAERLSDNMVLIGSALLSADRIGLVGGSGLMVEIGPGAPSAPTRPTGMRDFLSGAISHQGRLIFAGESGIQQAEAD